MLKSLVLFKFETKTIAIGNLFVFVLNVIVVIFALKHGLKYRKSYTYSI